MGTGLGLPKEPLLDRIRLADEKVRSLQRDVNRHRDAAEDWERNLIKGKKNALHNWEVYQRIVGELFKLEQILDAQFVNGHISVDRHALNSNTITELLIAFAYTQPHCEFRNSTAIEWAVAQGIYHDIESGQSSINSLIANRPDLLHRVGRGRYHLTLKGRELAQRVTRFLDIGVPEEYDPSVARG